MAPDPRDPGEVRPRRRVRESMPGWTYTRRAGTWARGLRRKWRRAAAQPLTAMTRVLERTPRHVRRMAARALIAAGRESGAWAGLRVVAMSLLDRRIQGLEWAERRAGNPSADATTRLALAQAALTVGSVATSDRIARTLDGAVADRPDVLSLRAGVALRSGRYREAGELARRARDLGARPGELASIERRAASELRVIEPGWRPTIPGGRQVVDPVPGRILHLVTNSLPHRQAGYTVRSQSIGRAQREVGLDPHFATQAGFPRNEGIRGAPAQDMVEGVPYHRLAPDFERALGPDATLEQTAREAEGLVSDLRPAALHAASHFHNAQVALALRERFGLPIVYEVRGFLEETWASRQGMDAARQAEDADRYRGAKAAETACMLAADAVVTLSETMRSDIVARGLEADRVVVVPNAVDVDRFTPRPRDAGLAGRLGLPDGVPVLGYVSSFTGYEGIRHLIDAAAILRDRGRAHRVLLVGDGEERDALEHQARRLGLLGDGTVLFTGRVSHEDVLGHYSLIDVFVVPRTADRVSQLVTPLKPYEAMALEKALVVSGVHALREIVTDGETGLVFVPEDADSLADTVEPLLDDPDRRRHLGRQAREWVTANRTWRQNGLRYLELYRRLGVA